MFVWVPLARGLRIFFCIPPLSLDLEHTLSYPHSLAQTHTHSLSHSRTLSADETSAATDYSHAVVPSHTQRLRLAAAIVTKRSFPVRYTEGRVWAQGTDRNP